MVTQERKQLTIQEAKRIIEEGKDKTDMLNRLNGLTKRQPAPPPPEGGISLSAASRVHGVPHPTISRWVKRGLIPIILRTKKELYIDEDITTMVVGLYKKNPGQGKKVLMVHKDDPGHIEYFPDMEGSE